MDSTKQSIFNASFEESINLENDGFRKLQQEQHDKLARKVINGKPTFSFKMQAFVLTLLFPVGFNYLLSLGASKFTTNDLGELRLQPASQNFFPWQVYVFLLSVWLLFVVIGKFFKPAFILPYRYQFHNFTYMIILCIEANLTLLGVLLSNLSIIFIVGYAFIWIFLLYFMTTTKVKALQKNMFNNNSEPRLQDRLAKIIGAYGMGVLGLAVILQRTLSIFLGNKLSSFEDLGMLLLFLIWNILVPAVVIFIGTPYFLQAYYKLKYPEQYRKYEGKSLEEWYGKKYLKKHKFINGTYEQG
ncbi:hypothetical protein SAMN05216347_102308 [Streptococcus equinus]|uniref:Uncharacterized protein n=1 Tax=Streptococcus equinus TaxID=1335 RepID=A0A1H0ME93_STREI|nr:hypothetical protein [Streptococcus equinus]SDO78724.1 hypothetical protein SAMN05216347_102308 [Streptococcus equinus]